MTCTVTQLQVGGFDHNFTYLLTAGEDAVLIDPTLYVNGNTYVYNGGLVSGGTVSGGNGSTAFRIPASSFLTDLASPITMSASKTIIARRLSFEAK